MARIGTRGLFLIMLVLVCVLLSFSPALCMAAEGGHGGFVPATPWVAFFGLMLLAIAVLPLLPWTHHWWESNKSKAKVSLILGLPVAVYIAMNDWESLSHTGIEYFQFLSLLSSLFIVAGGIHLSADWRATPRVNTLILLAGYVMASVVGTTGAAMLLIFPLLKTNSERTLKKHTVLFFIFLVCNTGGLLSPIGDPPLFLGYLRGIPFFWFMKLLPLWAVNGALLLGAYYFLDRYYYGKEPPLAIKADDTFIEKAKLYGAWNILLLIVVVASVALAVPTPLREAIMWGAAILSLTYSRQNRRAAQARRRNEFTFNAIIEVAVVFAGIFITMIPALALLRAYGAELGVTEPWQFFFATGAFSSVLDNAPTFLCFLELGQASTGVDAVGMTLGSPAVILGAISAGAVFMGANTYIGNAPNFMVRSIAEEKGVKMPSFFGYMLWSLPLLTVTFWFVQWLFFSLLPFPLF